MPINRNNLNRKCLVIVLSHEQIHTHTQPQETKSKKTSKPIFL